jgi:photosystem II stability/assembly factor-like uncharacterized protein
MKTQKILLAFALMVSLQSAAQASWSMVLEEYTGMRYDDVFFLNENLGWAAGSGGIVMKTTDGGDNWNMQLELEDTYIRNIEFLNENIGFLGTLEGIFYKTTNGGTTWTEVENIVPDADIFLPNDTFCGFDAVGTHTVYGCGSFFGPAYLIRSTDSGETWTYKDMTPYADYLVEVLFIDEQHGFVSGGNSNGGIILKTADGGENWTEIYHTGIEGEYVWKLQRLFSNPNVMFGAVESVEPLNGKLIKSVDGGVNWVSKEVPDTDIQAVGFITENHGWMGGHHTGFLETFDAGDTWTDTEFGGRLNRIQVFNENLAYCAGAEIYKFSDNLATRTPKKAEREKLEVHLAPNPIKNQLEFSVNFKRADHIILAVYDANGKQVTVLKNERITAAGKRVYSFPFPYPAGYYFLNLHNDSGAQSEKFIKK